jgi:hypothetical protein
VCVRGSVGRAAAYGRVWNGILWDIMGAGQWSGEGYGGTGTGTYRQWDCKVGRAAHVSSSTGWEFARRLELEAGGAVYCLVVYVGRR